MPGYLEKIDDPERGEPLPLGGFRSPLVRRSLMTQKDELGGEAWSETLEVPSDPSAYPASLNTWSSDV